MQNGRYLVHAALVLAAVGSVLACGSDHSGVAPVDVVEDSRSGGRADSDDVDEVDGSDPDAPDVDEIGDTSEIGDVDDAEVNDAGDGEVDADEVVETTFCPAGIRECATPTAWRRCNAEGSAWEEPFACGEEQHCSSGACLDLECRPEVMFLVDRSSSMQEEWESVTGSIRRVIEANPYVAYGLSLFPVDRGCAIGEADSLAPWPHVSIAAPELSAPAIESWLADNPMTVPGATPIEKSFLWFAENADTIWNPLAASRYLVLLTDGEDKCILRCGSTDDSIPCKAGVLETATEALLEASIMTYVIGYRYEDSPELLEAIAATGGTGLDTFVRAGDEDSLTNAFQLVLDDVKQCGR